MIAQNSSDPTGVSTVTPSTDHTNATRARQRKSNAAIQMRLAGATWNEIAQTLGYPTPRQALTATETALEKELRTTDDRDKLRRLAGARLERLLRSVWVKAIDPDHPDHLTAVTKARDIIDRHAKLYGLDAPTEIVVHNPSRTELEAWVATVVATNNPTVDEYDIIDTEEITDGRQAV